jgi:CxxC motif-containing protein (DUF1111 family)
MTGVGFAEPAPLSSGEDTAPVGDARAKAQGAESGASLGGLEIEIGRALFEKLWVAAPSSTKGSDGLGPMFNARACSNCHAQGGRSSLPEAHVSGAVVESTIGTVVKFTSPDAQRAFGTQLQDRTVTGAHHSAQAGETPARQPLTPEGTLRLRYDMRPMTLGDGTQVTMRRVSPQISGAAAHVEGLSLRVSPPLFGMGLIAGIGEAELRARADPLDVNGDGISGRVAEAYSPELGRAALARFGWRGGAVTLMDQSADAFSTDMGLSTPLFPDPQGDCLTCAGMAHGGDAGLRDGHEVSASTLDLVTRFVADLAVTTPPIGEVSSGAAQTGADLFAQAGCEACHVRDPYSNGARPYSDFLLHDMGEDLGDDGGREWRTAPLWGLNVPQTSYLHDGRAVTLLEAVLWHGGEARAARDRVARMTAAQREALLDYLRSL